MIKCFSFLVMIVFLVSCGKQKKSNLVVPKILKKTTRILSPSMNERVTLGEEVTFNIETEGAQLDSVIISTGNESTTFTTDVFKWTPATNRTGKFNFTVIVYSNKNAETHYPRLILLSDVVPEELTYEVVNRYPHATSSYVQGLFFYKNQLVESTGQRGESMIKFVNLRTGNAVATTSLSDKYFGEGSTYYKDELYMVTWTSGVGFVFDQHLNQKRTFRYENEGWGLTTMGDTLLMSDGSEKIYMMDPVGFTVIDQLEVYDNEGAVSKLNELEYVEGLLFANEWLTEEIHIIDPMTGRVLKTVDLSGLMPSDADPNDEVLNGIAYLTSEDRLFVTGKRWSSLYEIILKPKINLK